MSYMQVNQNIVEPSLQPSNSDAQQFVSLNQVAATQMLLNCVAMPQNSFLSTLSTPPLANTPPFATIGMMPQLMQNNSFTPPGTNPPVMMMQQMQVPNSQFQTAGHMNMMQAPCLNGLAAMPLAGHLVWTPPHSPSGSPRVTMMQTPMTVSCSPVPLLELQQSHLAVGSVTIGPSSPSQSQNFFSSQTMSPMMSPSNSFVRSRTTTPIHSNCNSRESSVEPYIHPSLFGFPSPMMAPMQDEMGYGPMRGMPQKKYGFRSKQKKIDKVRAEIKARFEEQGLFAQDGELVRGRDTVRIHVKTFQGLKEIQQALNDVERSSEVQIKRIACPFSKKNKFQKKGFIVYLKVESEAQVPKVQKLFENYQESLKNCVIAVPRKEREEAKQRALQAEAALFEEGKHFENSIAHIASDELALLVAVQEPTMSFVTNPEFVDRLALEIKQMNVFEESILEPDTSSVVFDDSMFNKQDPAMSMGTHELINQH